MTDRRTFLQSLAALPAAATLKSWAQASGNGRIALVIGNDAYADGPLGNCRNDAQAMGELLASAGFQVDTLLDAPRDKMLATLGRFQDSARAAGSKEIVFFYAGHGLQLDWQNYLVPVDARVTSGTEVGQRCIPLGEVLKSMGGSRDKTFVVMLDACRNNPFGDAFRPPQKGLSQFDAPPGSLIAFATAPGATASDGQGRNGLYTENLLRELAVRTVRVEDALKRVRLNVRLASRGLQVPWETTSLEGDVYLFRDGAKKLSEEELQAEIEADLAMWNATKASKNPDDWTAYLKRFPNGRFAEMAQVRLTRLIPPAAPVAVAMPTPVPESAPAPTPAPTPAPVPESAPIPAPQPESAPAPMRPAAASRKPLFVLGEGRPVPKAFARPDNPNSAGLYPIGRRYSPGDQAIYRHTSPRDLEPSRTARFHVESVDVEQDRVVLNGGRVEWDLVGNFRRSRDNAFDVPWQIVPAELHVGRKWTAAVVATTLESKGPRRPAGARNLFRIDFAIVAREAVTVPAGTFQAFRVEGYGTVGPNFVEEVLWYVPYFNFPIRWDREHHRLNAQFARVYVKSERWELESARQYAIES